MKQIKCIITLLFISSITFGQSDIKRKSVFLEIAGSGGLGSVNFEKLFCEKNNTEFTWRTGLSIAPIDKNNGTGIVFPLMVHSITGKGAHKLEFGLGQGITITTKGSFFAMTTASVGYRYAPEKKNWFYRATYTPLISYLVDFQIQQWGGLSVGYTFNNKSK
ncbi:MAG: hypothetical protein ACHQFW_04065 [Chitinophagales bacterium]